MKIISNWPKILIKPTGALMVEFGPFSHAWSGKLFAKTRYFEFCMNRAIDPLSRYKTPFEIGFSQSTLRFQIHMLQFIGFV